MATVVEASILLLLPRDNNYVATLWCNNYNLQYDKQKQRSMVQHCTCREQYTAYDKQKQRSMTVRVGNSTQHSM